MIDSHAHCGACGHRHPPDTPWPRRCAACEHTTYLNPLPVAVLLLPVDGGLLAVRRAIDPGRGDLALPGGFVDRGESWQQAAAREVREEAGVEVDPAGIGLFDTVSAPNGTLLVFGLADPVSAHELPPSTATDETDGWEVLTGPAPLAFPLHTAAVSRYFRDRGPTGGDR